MTSVMSFVKDPYPSYLAQMPFTKISAMCQLQSPHGGIAAEATKQGEQKSNSCDESQTNK